MLYEVITLYSYVILETTVVKNIPAKTRPGGKPEAVGFEQVPGIAVPGITGLVANRTGQGETRVEVGFRDTDERALNRCL